MIRITLPSKIGYGYGEFYPKTENYLSLDVIEPQRRASALGRQRRGRVSRLEATVVGSADL